MGSGSTAKRRRSGTESSANSATPSRTKPGGTGRGRGRPPNVPRDGRERPPPLAECFRKRCSDVLDRLQKKDHYNIFLEPVNTDDVVGYAETIKHPMDFTTMRNKLSRQLYKSLGEFRKDLDLIWSNCLLFNGKEPTNIFSKKAIELRRLTEKLIVTTRQYLEKDKENLVKWKEKHRRRKESMQANAASANGTLHGSVPGGSASLASRLPRQPANAVASDPMDTNTGEFAAEQNGRTPEENALAEALRLQYAGTTGLYKKGMLTAPYPQYTMPDGSVVEVPFRRYQPQVDHWNEATGIVRPVRQSSAQPLLCDSLPSSWKRNSCFPQPNLDSIRVEDYADSLYGFVENAGAVATHIVTELLSPELKIKKEQEDFLKQGYTLKDFAEKEKLDRQRAKEQAAREMANKWDTDAIAKLADDIERGNRRVVSMLPKLSRPINELDGMNGLQKFLDKKLVKEVEEVPVQVVDFTMPHGVSLATLTEIARLRNVPAVQMSQHDHQCIEALRKAAEDFTRRTASENRPRVPGASNLTPAQLHEVQMHARNIRQQRRVDAARQASLIEKNLSNAAAAQPNSLLAQHKRDLENIVQTTERADVAAARAGVAAARAGVAAARAAGAAYRSAPQQRMTETLPKAGVNPYPVGGQNASASAITHANEQAHPLPVTGRQRPRELWEQDAPRKAMVTGTAPPNGMIPAHGIALPQRPSPNMGAVPGVAKRSIQKTAKTSPPSSRRSPSSSGSRSQPVNPLLPASSPQFCQGFPPGHAIQPLPSIPSTFSGGTHPIVPSQIHAAAIFAAQSSAEARNTAPPQKLQASEAVRQGPASVFTNGVTSNSSPGAVAPEPNQPGVGPTLYREQHSNPVPMASQQAIGFASQGQPATFMALQGQQVSQQSGAPQQVQPPQIGVPNAADYSAQIQQSKNGAMMVNVNGSAAQSDASNTQTSLTHGVNTGLHLPGNLSKSQAGASETLVVPGSGSGSGIPPFAGNQTGANGTIGGSFGDSLSRGTFPNGSAVTPDAVEKDPILGDIFFADGPMDGPTGSPDFDF